MKPSLLHTQSTTVHISRLIAQLKREIERLTIRITAVERYQRQFTAIGQEVDDDIAEINEDISLNLETLVSDMTTYRQQLEDRLAHILQGYSALQTLEASPIAVAFSAYIYNDVRLLVRDVIVAREGYNELIENLVETIEQRD